MGIVVEPPPARRKRGVGKLVMPVRAKEVDQIPWDAFSNLSIDDFMSHPTRHSPQTVSDALADSPDSTKHLISPSTSGSSPLSPSSPHSTPSTASPSFRGGLCVDAFSGLASSSHRRLEKKCEGQDSMSFACNGGYRPTRWDSDRWSPNSNFEEKERKARGKSACKCAAGLTADVAVVCCCPFSVLHLLAIAFIKLPAAVVTKSVARMKQKILEKRRRSAVHEDDDESIPASSCPPSRSRSYEAGDIQTWAPALAFGGYKWGDYFDSPDSQVGSSGELLTGKS